MVARLWREPWSCGRWHRFGAWKQANATLAVSSSSARILRAQVSTLPKLALAHVYVQGILGRSPLPGQGCLQRGHLHTQRMCSYTLEALRAQLQMYQQFKKGKQATKKFMLSLLRIKKRQQGTAPTYLQPNILCAWFPWAAFS